jgi:hypothetical protein
MSQIKRKFIEDNAVSGAKIRLDNNETFKARNAANSADIDILKIRTDNILEFQVLPQANSSLPVPSAPKEFATIEYIQNVIQGKQDAKDAVNVLADANIPLTGAVPLVIDGVTLTAGMRVLLTAQTTASQNGIYTMGISGTYTLTRSSDANTSAAVTSGLYTVVISGTLYSGYEAILTTADPIVLDTTSLTFAKYPSTIALVAGDMLNRSGNTWTVDLASLSGLESTNAGNDAGQLRVKTDTASLEKDQSTRRDPSTGATMAKKPKKASFTLSPTDITNQFVDLTDVASQNSVEFRVVGAGAQEETTDYTVNYTGGVGSKTRITFAGGLATGGVSALVATDVVVVYYTAW